MIAMAVALALSSAAFHAGTTIPIRYTCDGANVSPPLRWTRPPAGTRSLALSMRDPDAPGRTFTHWLGWGLSPRSRGLPAGKRAPVEGRNDAGEVGYTGPCPPSGRHRYVFTLYALDTKLSLRRGASHAAFARGVSRHTLSRATLVGTYRR